MLVRRASGSDIGAIAEVHVAAWRETYRDILPTALLPGLSVEQRAAMWESDLRSDGTTLLVGEDKLGAIAGFAAAGPARERLPPCGSEIYALYVLRRAQGCGLGRELLGRLASALLDLGRQEAFLWVFQPNLGARRFYERLGGELVHEKETRFGEVRCIEVAYRWRDLARLARVLGEEARS